MKNLNQKENTEIRIIADFPSCINKGKIERANLEPENFKADGSYTIPSGLISLPLQCS